MNPVELYLSTDASLDALDFEPLVTRPSPRKNDFTSDGSKGNSLSFFAPDHLSKGALYRQLDGKLLIASPFGAFWLPLGSLDCDQRIELSNLSEGCRSTWPVYLGDGWRDGRGRPPPKNALRAIFLGKRRFEPDHSMAQMHLSVGGRKEWAIVFLHEPHSAISKTSSGVAIETPSGISFHIPKGREADAVAAGNVRWALPGGHGAFVLGALPW